MPALVVSMEETDLGLDRFRASVEEVTGAAGSDR